MIENDTGLLFAEKKRMKHFFCVHTRNHISGIHESIHVGTFTLTYVSRVRKIVGLYGSIRRDFETSAHRFYVNKFCQVDNIHLLVMRLLR